jgi:predicted amidohydrolase
MKISLVQMRCLKGRIQENLVEAARYVREAVSQKADVICFPEMSVTGYIDPTRDPEAVVALASDVVEQFCALTRGTRLTAMAGIVETNPGGKPFITQLVAREGELQGYYRKIHVAEDEEEWFAPGDTAPIFKHNDTPFGVAICADVGHGDLFAAYAEQGAAIVFVAAAPGLYGPQETRDWSSGFDWWRSECQRHLSAFARAGNMYIAVATQSGRAADEDFPGGGYVFGPAGKCLAATPDWSQGVLYAEVDIEAQTHSLQ